jgi:hypothetical protein
MDNESNVNYQPVTPAPITPDPTPPSEPITSPLKKKSSLIKRLIIIGVLAAALIGVGVGIHLLLSKTVAEIKHPAEATTTATKKTTLPNNLGEAYDELYSLGLSEFSPDKKAATLDELAILTSDFNLSDEFYDDDTSTMMALGIARLAIDDPDNRHEYLNEMYLLAQYDLTAVPNGIKDSTFDSSEDSQKTLAIYDKYTDKDLTSKVNQTLETRGLVAATQKALKLDRLEGYHVVALDFDNSGARQQQFAKEHDMFGAEPTMWVEEHGDETYIFMSKNYAQDFTIDSSVDHIVAHEIVHSQGLFARGNLGRMIEERRAEFLSGDKSEYYDAKQFFIYIEVFSGIDLLSQIEENPTDPWQFYVYAYKTFGLKAANALAASWPTAYLHGESEAIASADSFFGPNLVIVRAIELGKANQSAMEQRMSKRYDKLLSVFHTKQGVLDDIDGYLRQVYRLPAAATEMKNYISSNK